MRETDIGVPGNRTLHTYDSGEGDVVVYWHHGTPNLGAPPEPLLRQGVRWISHDRPRYGTSTAVPGRDVASVARDVAAVADALGVERLVGMGHSGGGTHALACAALLPERVIAAASISGPAPFDADLDWFAGMGPTSHAALTAAAQGRAARAAVTDGDPDFTEADWAAFTGPWSWFGKVVGPALAAGPDAAIDDDLAYTHPWGFDPATITAPVLLVHGADDLMIPATHSRWLAEHITGSELRLLPGEGHISALTGGAAAVDWLVRRAS